MTNRTFEVPVTALTAALTHAAKDDIRYYLNGVYLDAESGRIVATDGHRLLVIPCDAVRDGKLGVILPRDAVDFVLTTYRKMNKRDRVCCAAVVVTAGPDFELTVRFATGQSYGCKAIDGRFPDYGRIIPRELDGTPGSYNPEYILAASDALASLTGSNHPARVFQNGPDKPCIVQHVNGPALAVVMPMRMQDQTLDVAWLDVPVADRKAA